MCCLSYNITYGFNRNIVECKGSVLEMMVALAVVLIETLWNVKVDVPDLRRQSSEVLIETLWNVKKAYPL